MTIQALFLATLVLSTGFFAAKTEAASLYDCNGPRPEMAGFHNMVLFGAPGDQLYVYHLPLFAGATNGTSGHVLMHVYQGLWGVELDATTKAAYELKYMLERAARNPNPFFTIGPKGKPFKVPEMICNSGFSTEAWAVYGHIESNPDFPAPDKLKSQLSTVTVKGPPILARRFDGTSRAELTYLIFGTSKAQFMVHFLTDDENSFDQIVGVEILDAKLKSAVESAGSLLVSVPNTPENGLLSVSALGGLTSPNNKFKLPVSPLGKILKVKDFSTMTSGQIKITGEIYFNANDDLKK